MSRDYGRFNLEGFKWGKAWIPKTYLDDANITPVFWDPDLSDLPDSYWQTGIGGGIDLKYKGFIEEINGDERRWRPQVNHGYYYFGEQYHYMFSDGGTSDYFRLPDTDFVNASNWMKFSHVPKIGVPIIARQYERVSSNILKVYREFKKVNYFRGRYDSEGVELSTWDEDTESVIWANVDTDEPEMMVIYHIDPTIAGFSEVPATGIITVSGVTNNNYIFDVGGDPIGPGHTWSMLYNVGISDGTEFQTFNLPYAPVDSGTAWVYVYDSGIMPVPSNAFAFSIEEGWNAVGAGENKCIIDRDMGTVHFGDGVGSGVIPSGNYEVGVRYVCNIGVEYEKEKTTDLTTGWETALEQLKKASNRNFLTLAEGISDPDSITLTADLPTMSPTYGPLKVGNNFANLIAEVLDSNNTPIENQDIEFYFTSTIEVGAGLGSRSSISSSASSNSDGNAYTRMLGPPTIYDLGEYVDLDNALPVPGNILHLKNIEPTYTSLNEIFTYTVEADDEVLGIYQVDALGNYDRDANLDPFFAGRGNFQVDSGIYVDSGVDNRLGAGAYITDAEGNVELWERVRRSLWEGLEDVAEFTANEQSGRKRIVSAWSGDAINPHTGALGAFIPLTPSGINDMTATDSGIDLSYPANLPEINSGVVPSGIHGFFVVGPALVSVQAKTYNRRRNNWVYSNEIDVYIGVGEEGKGTYYFDTVNTLPSGVLGSGIEAAADSGIIPFGWRLPSTNPVFTVAGSLDRMTFIDIN